MTARASTSVHNIETSVRFSLPPSYQDFSTKFLPAEWLAVHETYEILDQSDGKNRTGRLDDCRKIAWFVRNDKTGQVRVSANHCHLRWCPLCAAAKKTYVAHELHEWLRFADHPKMLTLTLLHSKAPLVNQVNALYKCFRNLRLTKLIRKTATGGIWFFQIKYNSDRQEWHPHIHVLLTGRYIPQGKLSQLWLKITHSSKIVDIRSVTDTEKAAFEVGRYCARPSPVKDIPPTRRTELFTAMHGRRICGTWGTGRQVKLNHPRNPEPGTWTRLCRWNTLRMQLDFNPDAKAIYEAWKNGDALPPDVTLIEYEDFIDNVVEEIEPEPPPKLLWSD